MLLAPLLFQTVSSPHATSAPLFCGQFVLTFPTLQSEIYSRPFLCCSTPFTHASLKSHSPRSCWGPVSFWLAASAIFTVLLLSNWSLRKKMHSKPRTDGQTGALTCPAAPDVCACGEYSFITVSLDTKPHP